MLEPIVCVDKSWGFSKENIIPWHFSSDLKLFAKITKTTINSTKKNICIMGRITWEGIPINYRPLKDRINIVVSTTLYEPNKDNLYFVKSIEDGIKLCLDLYIDKKVERVFVCGGLSLYNYALNSVLLSKVHITKINKEYNCDKFINKDLLFNKCYNDMAQQIDFNENDIDLSYMIFENHKIYKDEDQYLALLWDCLINGEYRCTRNSNTWSLFGSQLIFDLKKGFPMTTTRKTFLRSIFYELKMFLLGETDTKKWLGNKNIKIWEGNTNRSFLDSVGLTTYPEGSLGNMYGYQWSHFGQDYLGPDVDYTNKGFNQIAYVCNLLKKDKNSRRILMSAYDPSRANQGPLYPCHSLIIQFYVENNNELCAHMYQRSSDSFLGLNYNISSTSLLVHLFANVINNDPEYDGIKYIPGRVIISLGDYHIYECHLDAVKTQLSRNSYNYPILKINKESNNFVDFEWEDIEVIDYKCYPHIAAPMIA